MESVFDLVTPKKIKGGALAPLDIPVLRDAVLFAITYQKLEPEQKAHLSRIYHRLGRIE